MHQTRKGKQWYFGLKAHIGVDLKLINAGLLNVGYAEAGPANGTPVILLHGWPYDICSFVDVVPILASAGYHVFVPYLRGYGSTRFLSADTFRNVQPSVVAVDIINLMDALKINKAIIAGFDWGARTADIMAVLWPERCKGIVSVSGYLIGSQESGKAPLPPNAELEWWYQFYFATERGRAGYDKYRHDFAKLIWKLASPKWNFDDATFDRSAASFDNPDHVAIVIHNYRWRLGLAEGETKYDELDKRLAQSPVLGTGATFEADLNLVVQVVMGVALIAGALLAKRKRYVAHGICQTTVLLLNLGMIGFVMWPAFQQQVTPALPGSLRKWYFATATIHALLGGTAELLGLYIVVVAGTRVLPQWLRFKDWKRWMRAELMLWSIVVLTGVGTYYAWYIAPFG